VSIVGKVVQGQWEKEDRTPDASIFVSTAKKKKGRKVRYPLEGVKEAGGKKR